MSTQVIYKIHSIPGTCSAHFISKKKQKTHALCRTHTCTLAHLLIGVQQKAVPDGAHAGRGEHALLPSAAAAAAARETHERHDALHEHHRVVEHEEETVGEEAWQNLQGDPQVRAQHSHALSRNR